MAFVNTNNNNNCRDLLLATVFIAAFELLSGYFTCCHNAANNQCFSVPPPEAGGHLKPLSILLHLQLELLPFQWASRKTGSALLGDPPGSHLARAWGTLTRLLDARHCMPSGEAPSAAPLEAGHKQDSRGQV